MLKKRLEEEKGDVHQPSSSRFIVQLNLSCWSFNNFLPYISCFQHFPVDLAPPEIQTYLNASFQTALALARRAAAWPSLSCIRRCAYLRSDRSSCTLRCQLLICGVT